MISRNLKRITITGADDSVHPHDLVSIADSFPFVEWGILIGTTQRERFPSIQWLDSLYSEIDRQNESSHVPSVSLSLSLHICNRLVRDICKGKWTIFELFPIQLHKFQRLQLNFSPYFYKLKPDLFCKGVEGQIDVLGDLEIIFQLNPDWFERKGEEQNWRECSAALQQMGIKVSILCDGSGGRGVLADNWRNPWQCPSIGFAGGLTPQNINNQLQVIMAEHQPAWIDVESGVRTDDSRLDINKVGEFLTNAYRFFGE